MGSYFSFFYKDIIKESAVIEEAKKLIYDAGHVNKGDLVIFTAGAPYSDKSRLNWLKFEII